MNILYRLLGVVSTILSIVILFLTIRRMRRPTRFSRLTPIVAIAATLLTTGLYMWFTGASVNWLLVVPVVFLGLLLGLAEGQLTRCSLSGAIVVGKRTGFYMILWGLSYLATLLLGQFGDAGMHAAGVLTMMFGLGIVLGSNYVLIGKINRALRSRRAATI